MNRILTALLFATGIFSASRESLAYRDPAPLSYGPGNLLVVYAVADDGWGLFRNAWVPAWNNWGGWQSVTAPLPISNIAVALFENKEVIFIQSGNQLLTNLGVDIPPPPPSCPNCLTTWNQIDSTSVPPVLVNKDRLTVYFKNGGLRARRYDWANGFRSWQPATGPSSSVGSDFDSIAVGKVNSSSYVICGARGTQYICSPQMGSYSDWPSGSWSTLPGVWNSPPSVNTFLGLPMVFGRGFYDNQLYSVGQFFGWETPVARGGDIASRPAGINIDTQQTHIFAKAGWNNTIWYTYQVSGNWGPWLQMP